ncbi:MAG: hypothetical protein KZQ66_20225 [Candidatus Thiodiazotropha sp. (ex Lucinoma aequizonata)]|nr:hypothetical protein [Candidatus Thiodiazotropha sp. (ex Lucinoma aequizonata)]MCU7896541.1 hypothetical protein [Candidatus Thiodiazotropha sp. (ex Lucinoma aequizonata)]MCU7904017.1 hypothetical protein [Candidatus Thiodiazotropha sp. (ex Lucinoma aequizonata)]
MTAYCAPTVLRTSGFRIALPEQAARTLLHHDYRNDSTASRMRSLYALHLSLSVAISVIQARLRLSGTNRLRSAFHGGQRGQDTLPFKPKNYLSGYEFAIFLSTNIPEEPK